MIANDVSARSVTFKEGRSQRPWDEFYDWLNGKWADGFFPTGPYLVTKDEITDVQSLRCGAEGQRQVRQDANTSQMIYSVADVGFIPQPPDDVGTGRCHLHRHTGRCCAMATGNIPSGRRRDRMFHDGLGTLANVLGPRPRTFYEPLETQCLDVGGLSIAETMAPTEYRSLTYACAEAASRRAPSGSSSRRTSACRRLVSLFAHRRGPYARRRSGRRHRPCRRPPPRPAPSPREGTR